MPVFDFHTPACGRFQTRKPTPFQTSTIPHSKRRTHRAASLPRVLIHSNFDRTLFSNFENYTTRATKLLAAFFDECIISDQ
jgi:hypothetical protein